MRSFILSLIVAGATLGTLAVAPSTADARPWYGGGGYYYNAAPAYYYNSAPAYNYSSYYYAPGTVTEAVPATTYSYPVYSGSYYAPSYYSSYYPYGYSGYYGGYRAGWGRWR